jgi:hypothetical protein
LRALPNVAAKFIQRQVRIIRLDWFRFWYWLRRYWRIADWILVFLVVKEVITYLGLLTYDNWSIWYSVKRW